MMGANAETIVKAGKGDLLGDLVAFIKQNGLVAGIGSHAMEIPILSEQEKFEPDFISRRTTAWAISPRTRAT